MRTAGLGSYKEDEKLAELGKARQFEALGAERMKIEADEIW